MITKTRIFLWVVGIAGLIAIAILSDLRAHVHPALIWISGSGPMGMGIFVGLYILLSLLFVPSLAMAIGAGAAFGLLTGFVLASISGTLGATAAFLIGRSLLRHRLEKKLQDNENFRNIHRAVGTEGWKIVALTRLSPFFPFNFLNYAFGLTRISLKHYFFATWAGMVPETFVCAYLGYAAGTLTELETPRTVSPAEWCLFALGLIATLAVVTLVTKIAKKELARRVPGNGTDQSR